MCGRVGGWVGGGGVWVRVTLVGRGPTSAKNGRLGDITIPGFVPLHEFCSPIRLQPSSVCLHWPTYGM